LDRPTFTGSTAGAAAKEVVAKIRKNVVAKKSVSLFFNASP
jgi:hypothetical protein